MATVDEISRVRRMTALAEDDPTYTDSLVGGMIDDLGEETAVVQIWREKAAGVADLVDITESGSSRSLSKLRDAYLGMADKLTPSSDTPPGGRAFTVEVERV